METFPFFHTQISKKRRHQIDLDQLETERAKRRYVSEFLSSELTALSLKSEESHINSSVGR